MRTFRGTWTRGALVSLALCTCGPPDVPHLTDDLTGRNLPQAQCETRNKDRPMVVEWSAADRSALEAESAHGVVVVAYEGCSLRILSGCTVSGGYEFTATTPARDYIEVQNEDELYAELPLVAANFGAEVRAGKALRLDYVVRGQRRATIGRVQSQNITGQGCEEATHWVRAMMVGASTLSSRAQTEAAGHAKAFGAEAGGRHAGSSEQLKTNGDIDSCEQESSTGCLALIQLDLSNIEGSGAQVAVAAPAGPSAPAMQIAPGAQVTEGTLQQGDATLTSGEFFDRYDVQVSAGATLRAAVESPDFDTYLIVRSPSGQQRDNDDFSQGNTNSGLEIPSTEAGTYVVQVTSYQPGESGRYRLSIATQGGQALIRAQNIPARPTVPPANIQSNFGTVTLRTGFPEDPTIVRGTSGGSLQASAWNPSCTGYLTEQPDHILVLQTPFQFLRIYATTPPPQDTTLVIGTPSGGYLCNDDYDYRNNNLNPLIEGPFQAGVYKIWVASYRQEDSFPYQLHFTELPQNHP